MERYRARNNLPEPAEPPQAPPAVAQPSAAVVKPHQQPQPVVSSSPKGQSGGNKGRASTPEGAESVAGTSTEAAENEEGVSNHGNATEAADGHQATTIPPPLPTGDRSVLSSLFCRRCFTYECMLHMPSQPRPQWRYAPTRYPEKPTPGAAHPPTRSSSPSPTGEIAPQEVGKEAPSPKPVSAGVKRKAASASSSSSSPESALLLALGPPPRLGPPAVSARPCLVRAERAQRRGRSRRPRRRRCVRRTRRMREWRPRGGRRLRRRRRKRLRGLVVVVVVSTRRLPTF